MRRAWPAAGPMLLAAAAWAGEPETARDAFLAGAAAAEVCAGRKLSMIEELRLEQLVRADSAISDNGRGFAALREQATRAVAPECDDAAVRERARRFVDTVVPVLQRPVLRP